MVIGISLDMGHWTLPTSAYEKDFIPSLVRCPVALASLVSERGGIHAGARREKVLEKFRAVRPGARELRLIELDWAPTLAARKSGRRARGGRCCWWWCGTARATCAADTAERTPRT